MRNSILARTVFSNEGIEMPGSGPPTEESLPKTEILKVKIARSQFDQVECDAKSHTDFQETGVFGWHK